MKPNMLKWLAEHAAGCERIVEVGCYHGRTTRVLLDNSKAHIWCIDSWSVEGVTEVDFEAFQRTIADSLARITILRMDSAKAAKQLSSEYGPKFFDFAFIDGGHDYETVKADILGYRPLVRGILAGHDFSNSWPGVKKAVKECVPGFEVMPKGTIWWVEIR